jgi:hypothetical protein
MGRGYIKEFISKMEGNTGNVTDIPRSEIHGGHCVHTITYTERASFLWENLRIPPAGGVGERWGQFMCKLKFVHSLKTTAAINKYKKEKYFHMKPN